MGDTVQTVPERQQRWFQGVNRYAWIVLIIATLGWMFDTFDHNLFTVIRQKSVLNLLEGNVPPGQLDAAAKTVGAHITSVFLIGWALGGFFFGVMGDRLGRVRTMAIAILTYAVFTGLNALVQNPLQYAVCRFLTAFGVGGEFAAGTALVAEVWPERSRAMALGTLQALSAVGNMLAAVVSLVLSGVSWRWVYVVGALPALLVIWIQLAVREPERWTKAKQAADAEGGSDLGAMSALFCDPELRRNTIAGVLLALAGVGGLWGVAFFLPDLIGSVLKPAVAALPKAAQDAQLQRFRSYAFFVQQAGAFFGMFAYAVLSERMGRKPSLLFFLMLAFVVVQGTFWGVRDITSACLWAFALGFSALAPFSAYAVYFPELFPTRVRATGVGFCYNCARLLAAFAPSALGSLAAMWSSPTDAGYGYRVAASIVSCVYLVGLVGLVMAPETKGKPLPE